MSTAVRRPGEGKRSVTANVERTESQERLPMPARRRSTVAATAAAALVLGGGAWAVTARTTPSAASHTAAPRATASDRFHQLTGDRSSEKTAGKSGKTPPGQAKKVSERTCPTDSATVGMTPNGWCIRPAGKNVDVFRFPLGVVPVD